MERRRDPSLNEIRSVERVERAVMQIRIRDISRRIRRGEREEGWRAFDTRRRRGWTDDGKEEDERREEEVEERESCRESLRKTSSSSLRRQ